ncbi:biotin transporter BioY [Fructilactobacillus myrtifloralis]|uniref:Biotin transporter n=1 Tax=Fructilactobacillus myrtifloralis TaxID=2940301 RepID=A0ABY5BMZ2_9LACO|nr:biotin transporter BioY [Fructilactobacillus myrtifloralis]USS84586.1 biotin transporter BioY [Fructilactobacillus myrtifloralis]
MKLKEITYCGLMVAIIASLGFIPLINLPFFPVPISFQSAGIMLAGSLLGRKLGFWSVVVFLLLVAVGLPLLAGFRGGIGVFAGPTAGYLLSWPVCAYVIGLLVTWLQRVPTFIRFLLANLLGGMVLMNCVGASYLVWQSGLSWSQVAVSSLAFIPGDGLKAVLVALIVTQLQRHHRLPHVR